MAEPQSPSETPVAKPSKLPVRGHWSLSVFFVVANAIGFWLFARGFLLTRMVLSDHSHSLVLPFEQSHSTPAPDAANASWYPAKFERSIVLVVDALRIDFATFSSELNATDDRVRKMPYHNNLPIIDRVMQSRPSHSMLYRFRADPPTTTLQRLKALTTGQLPTFIDAGSNFAGSAIDEDNWLQAIRGREGSGYKRNLVFLGDDTWSSLFPNELADTFTDELNSTEGNSIQEYGGWARIRPFPSLNVWDLHTVDDGVLSRLPLFLGPPEYDTSDEASARREAWRGLVEQKEMLEHSDLGGPSLGPHNTMANGRVGFSELHEDWDTIIAHCLGVDHCGHRFGPDHPAMALKLQQMNQAIKMIVDAVDKSDKSTVLYVFGDHGMDPKGDHGGDSPREVDAALWVYSNTEWNSKRGAERSGRVLERAQTLIDEHKIGRSLDEDLRRGWWKNTHLSDEYRNQEGKALFEAPLIRSTPQIDIVSTMALVLGLPVPFNNLGAVIPEMFASDDSVDGEWGLLHALRLNSAQVVRYLNAYMAKSHSHGFSDDVVRMWDELYDQAQQSYADLKQLKTTRNKNIIAEGEEEAAAQYYAFLRIMLGTLRQMWAQFDPVLILAGLAIMLLSLTSLSLVYWRSQQSSLETIASKTLAGSAAGGIIGLVASKALDTVLSATAASSHASQLDLAVVGLTVGALGSFCFQALVNYQAGVGIDDTSPPGFWRGIPVVLNGVAILVTFFHFLVFTSNSYTFNEDSVVLYLLQTLTLVLFGAALSTLASKPETQQAAGQRAAICAFAILVLNRISSYSTVCREEQIPGGCKPTFYGSESASISSVWLAVANLGMVWIVPSVVLRFLRRSRSDTASVARLWLGIGMRASMGMAAVYWILDSIDAEAALEPKASGGNWSELRILLARTSVGIALGGGLAAWLASPFCLDVAIADASTTKAAKHKKQAAQPKRTAIILGFGNAYGVAYLLFVTVVFCVLYLVQQPMGGIMLSVLFVEILLAMELFDALHDALQCSMSLVPAQVVMLGLLSYMGYFATGHQFTLVSLQWSTAFVGVREMQLVVCGVIVGLNTLGAFVLGAMGVPLVALWNQSLGTQLLRIAPGNFMARVTGAAAAYLAYHAAVSTSSAIFAAVFRRHLMVWKVFAPRFMFSVPVLLGSVVLALCLAVGFAAVRVLRMGLGVGSAQSLVADRIRAK